MKTIKTFMKGIYSIAIMGAAIVTLSVPVSASAATVKPTCSLKVTTPTEVISIKNKEKDVSIKAGDQMTIVWDSKNAKTATDINGNSIELSGTKTDSPQTTTTYSYKFISGSKKVTCAVTANIVGGSIDADSLTTTKSKPKLSGTATGTKSVKVIITEEGSSKKVFSSKSIKVKSNKWKVEVTKKLSNGVYNVTVTAADGTAIASGSLTIGSNTSTSNKSNSTLLVSSVPLLVGGTARAGSSVPVSYLQITNMGKESAIVKGFNVKQNGTASVNSVIGFTTVDDKSGSRGSVGGTEGSTPFKNGVAFVPVTNVVLAPREMKLFTIKAVMTSNVSAYIGTQLMIDVVSVESNSKVSGSFPIRGTTWTIGY